MKIIFKQHSYSIQDKNKLICIAKKKRIPFEVLCTFIKSEVERQANGEKDVKRIGECISDEGSKKLHVAKFC